MNVKSRLSRFVAAAGIPLFLVVAAVWVSTCDGATADIVACGAPQRTLLISAADTWPPLRELMEVFRAGCPNWAFALLPEGGHMAPLTLMAILKSLPLQDRVHRYADKFIYIETGLVIGAEKQKTKFQRGDVAFLTSNGSICVFVQDAAVQPMNPIGAIADNIEIVESSQPGDIMVVKKSSA